MKEFRHLSRKISPPPTRQDGQRNDFVKGPEANVFILKQLDITYNGAGANSEPEVSTQVPLLGLLGEAKFMFVDVDSDEEESSGGFKGTKAFFFKNRNDL